MKYPKTPRLKEFDYLGPYAYFVTLCCSKKCSYFTDQAVVDAILELLVECTHEYGFQILSYCSMPDHLHLLVQGEENSSLGKFIRVFKQKSEYYFSKKAHGFLWQRSYYDHVLRKEESIEEVAKYILENPVRKGLVDNFVDYPFLGSMTFDIKEP